MEDIKLSHSYGEHLNVAVLSSSKKIRQIEGNSDFCTL